eukprot:scaffold104115_cov22-Tisochrysis_lutea.AAC.2
MRGQHLSQQTLHVSAQYAGRQQSAAGVYCIKKDRCWNAMRTPPLPPPPPPPTEQGHTAARK